MSAATAAGARETAPVVAADTVSEAVDETSVPAARRDADRDALAMLDGVPLTDAEDAYVRAANTLRGYLGGTEFAALIRKAPGPPVSRSVACAP